MPLNNNHGIFNSLHMTIWYATTRIKQQTWPDPHLPYNILGLTYKEKTRLHKQRDGRLKGTSGNSNSIIGQYFAMVES